MLETLTVTNAKTQAKMGKILKDSFVFRIMKNLSNKLTSFFKEIA